jgi:hypothetical protein
MMETCPCPSIEIRHPLLTLIRVAMLQKLHESCGHKADVLPHAADHAGALWAFANPNPQ